MTVKELIEKLKKEDPDRVVVMSSDQEGNHFNTLEVVQTGAYSDGEVGLERLTPALRKEGYSEDDVFRGDGAMKAVILWP